MHWISQKTISWLLDYMKQLHNVRWWWDCCHVCSQFKSELWVSTFKTTWMKITQVFRKMLIWTSIIQEQVSRLSLQEDVIQTRNRLEMSSVLMSGVPRRDVPAAGPTHRLQLVHEFDQELSALWCFAVKLHARLHRVESTCRTEREGKEFNIVLPLSEVRSSVAESYGRLVTQTLMNFSQRRGKAAAGHAVDVSLSSSSDQTQTHGGAGGKRLPLEPPQAWSHREELQLPQSLICQLVLHSDMMESFKVSSEMTWAAAGRSDDGLYRINGWQMINL